MAEVTGSVEALVAGDASVVEVEDESPRPAARSRVLERAGGGVEVSMLAARSGHPEQTVETRTPSCGPER